MENIPAQKALATKKDVAPEGWIEAKAGILIPQGVQELIPVLYNLAIALRWGETP